MLTIRESQENALAEVLIADWLLAELTRLFPAQCAARGAPGLEQLISSGGRRARTQGFTRDDYLPYLALEICLGENFLDRPENEWARRAMKENPGDRMQSLYRAAIFYFAELAEIEEFAAASAALALSTGEDDNGESPISETDYPQEGDSTGEQSHV
jgi:hypothetical protein